MAVHDETGVDSQTTPSLTLLAAVVLALAHLGLVVLQPSVGLLASFEVVVFAGIVTLFAVSGPGLRVRDAIVIAAVFVILVGGSWLLVDTLALHWSALGFAVGTVVLSYGLHRYHLLALGVLEVSNES